MTRVRLSADVDPELRRRVRIAAASADKSVSEWIEDALRRELENERRVTFVGDTMISMPPPGVKPRGSRNPVKLRGSGDTVADAVIEDRR